MNLEIDKQEWEDMPSIGLILAMVYKAKINRFFIIGTNEKRSSFILSVALTDDVEKGFKSVGVGLNWDQVNECIDAFSN